MDKTISDKILGDLYFKKVLYVLTDFNDKSIIKGICIQVESSMQRGLITINISGKFKSSIKEDLNNNPDTFNKKIELKDILLIFKENSKYQIWSTQLKFPKTV